MTRMIRSSCAPAPRRRAGRSHLPGESAPELLLVEYVADLGTASNEVGACRLEIGYHQVQTARGTWSRRREVRTKLDRAPRAWRRDLEQSEAVTGDVGVNPPAETLIKLRGSLNVGDRDDDDLQLQSDGRVWSPYRVELGLCLGRCSSAPPSARKLDELFRDYRRDTSSATISAAGCVLFRERNALPCPHRQRFDLTRRPNHWRCRFVSDDRLTRSEVRQDLTLLGRAPRSGLPAASHIAAVELWMARCEVSGHPTA